MSNRRIVPRTALLLVLLAGCASPSQQNSDLGAGSDSLSPFITDPRAHLEASRTNAPAPKPNVDVASSYFITDPRGRIPVASTNAAPQVSAPATNPPPVVAITNAPAPRVQVVKHASLPTGWYAWEQWHTTNWSRPLRVRSTGAWTYQLKSAEGLLELTAGRRTALWNGMNIELGFPPRLTNGEPIVHSLDWVKTFEPLLFRSPLSEKQQRTIVIDPGHGGENFGAKSIVANRYEKELALDWALRVEPLLKARGWHVVLTRTNDIDLSLADRVALADAAHADLFLSLHFNSSDQPQGQSDHGGVETYCLTPVGMPSTVTRHFDDELNHAFPNNAFDRENFFYATRLHRELVYATQRHDRGVRRARFMGVLRMQNRPAVLVEGGYLTHPGEAEVIATASYRQKLADGVAKALGD